MSTYVSIERNFDDKPIITYWHNIEKGDERAHFLPKNDRKSWYFAYHLARSLRRLNGLMIAEGDFLKQTINVRHATLDHSILQVSVAHSDSPEMT